MPRKRPMSVAERCKRWRQRHPKQTAANSKAWRGGNRAKYLNGYRGRNYIKLLENALVRLNDKSKIFADAGMTMSDWVMAGTVSVFHIRNPDAKLSPVKSWREFDLSLPEHVRRFLNPRNFRLVPK